MTTTGYLFEQMTKPIDISTSSILSPAGYSGLYAFHKYWGKKPHEPLAYVIQELTSPNDIVLDPFVGSGTVAREAVARDRRFIGFDINPCAIELTKLILNPPELEELHASFKQVRRVAYDAVEESYRLEDGRAIATHYLWDANQLSKVWVRSRHRTARRGEFPPTLHDIKLAKTFAEYRSRKVRLPRFFTNGRINAKPTLTLSDLFTGRAQRNIDIILDAIDTCPVATRLSLRLCLTAASGQMSKMVFAVTNRGKTKGEVNKRMEVGSWVIGFWRPRLHLEVNAWNCFENRVAKLLNSLKPGSRDQISPISGGLGDLLASRAKAHLSCGDCRELLRDIPDDTVDLILTDPPHGDRIPYLELSEIWNCILGFDVDFEREIVFSNAKERGKSSDVFSAEIGQGFRQLHRVLKPDGIMLIIFNARDTDEWQSIRALCRHGFRQNPLWSYLGYFPCQYSATSVVQDNRAGSMCFDLVLAFARYDAPKDNNSVLNKLRSVPSWTSDAPVQLSGGKADDI